MVWVALAGPATQHRAGFGSGGGVHGLDYLPANSAQLGGRQPQNTLVINVVLAIFNMMPIPPLDGGRVAVGPAAENAGGPAGPAGAVRNAILSSILIILPLAGFASSVLNLDVMSTILRNIDRLL